jgi:undecaprenyl-diphosphatase
VVLYAAERMRRPRPVVPATAPPSDDLLDAGAPTQGIEQVDPAAPTQVINLAGAADPGRGAAQPAQPAHPADFADRRLAALSVREAVLIGATQILALLPGISRSGITIVGGLARGLRHDDAARFAFLLSTPVILAAGVLKVPSLFAPEYHAVLGPALVGSLVAGVCAYVSVRFLTSYFETRTLTPFAVYCVVVGLGSLVYLAS